MSDTAATSQTLHTLYREHHGWLKSWLRSKLGCSEQAADMAQDIFVRILRNREIELREPRSFLTTIARRVMIDHFRRQSLERAYLDALALMPEPIEDSPETRVLMVETLCEIDAMLHGLGSRARQAFLLSQLDGLGYADIAQRLGVSVSSVKKYVARAMEQCLLLAFDGQLTR